MVAAGYQLGMDEVAALGLGDKLAGEEFQDGAVEAGLGQVLEEGLIGIAAGLLRVELVGEEDDFAQGVQGRVGEGVPTDGGVDDWIVEAVILPEEFGANGTVEQDGHLLVDEADGDLEALGLGKKLGVGQVAGDIVGQGGEGGALGVDAVAGGQVFGDVSNPLDVGPEARGELGNAGCDALFRSFHWGRLFMSAGGGRGWGLTHAFQLAAAQKVHVEVRDLLAGVAPLVDHQAEAAAGDAFAAGHFFGDDEHVPDEGLLVGADLGQGHEGHDGDDEQVDRGLGVDVAEDDNLLVAVDGVGMEGIAGDVGEDGLGGHGDVTSSRVWERGGSTGSP